MRKLSAVAGAVLFAVFSITNVEAETKFFPKGQIPIDRFYEVAPGIYRGARPSVAGMLALAQLGIKTDINIDNDDDAIEDEAEIARQLGMKYVSVPLSGFWKPKTSDVDYILKELTDPKNFPVFIHCKHGEDRTGLLIGLFRVEHQRWEPKVAYREMLDKGFHPILWGLREYFEDRTGYIVPQKPPRPVPQWRQGYPEVSNPIPQWRQGHVEPVPTN